MDFYSIHISLIVLGSYRPCKRGEIPKSGALQSCRSSLGTTTFFDCRRIAGSASTLQRALVYADAPLLQVSRETIKTPKRRAAIGS